MLSITWTTPLPATYSHVLLVDVTPANIPYAVVQSPLCGDILTYIVAYDTGLAAPAWVSANPGYLELTPSALGLVGTYTFDVVVSEALSGV